MRFMRRSWCWLGAAVVLLIAAPIACMAVAQERKQGWLGARVETVTKEEADTLGWEGPRGAKVTDLIAGSPAATGGLELGDVITTLDGVEVETGGRLIDAVMGKG